MIFLVLRATIICARHFCAVKGCLLLIINPTSSGRFNEGIYAPSFMGIQFQVLLWWDVVTFSSSFTFEHIWWQQTDLSFFFKCLKPGRKEKAHWQSRIATKGYTPPVSSLHFEKPVLYDSVGILCPFFGASGWQHTSLQFFLVHVLSSFVHICETAAISDISPTTKPHKVCWYSWM